MNYIAQTIENEMKLMTTHQKLYNLRKSHSDADILDALDYCTDGIRMAMTSLINKQYCSGTEIIEREELVDKDIIESMME